MMMALALAVVAGPVQAKDWGYDLGSELMSPFCPGRTLASCPSPQAAELVQWIVTQEAAGTTREEVLEILVERYGEEILGAPPAEGITLWAYIFPVAGFMGFGVVAFFVLRRIVGQSAGSPASAAPPAVPPATASAVGVGGEALASGVSAEPLPTAETDEELARLVDAELASRG
jgi:cytochrome c-type biogenesis protein CcmH